MSFVRPERHVRRNNGRSLLCLAYSLYLKVGRSLPVLSVLVFFRIIALAGGLERVTEGSYRDSRAGVGAAFLFSPTKLPS